MPLSRLSLVVALALSMALVAAAPALAESPQQEMARAVNALRAAHNVAPMTVSPGLTRSSSRNAQRMMARDYFGHLKTARVGGRPRGEVVELHYGRRPSVAQAVRQWADSPGHRSVLLSPTFRYVGAGLSYGRFKGRRAAIWVVHVVG